MLGLALMANGCATAPASETVDTAAIAPAAITAVAVGEAHGCALLETGQVFCWGLSDCGASGSDDASLRARRVPDLEGVIAIATADRMTCALQRDRLVCSGQHWDPYDRECRYAERMTIPMRGRRLSVGRYGVCVVTDDGHARCRTGRRWRARTCEISTEGAPCAKLTAHLDGEWWTWIGVDDAIDVAVGTNHVCVLRASGVVACDGMNTMGSFGIARAPSAIAIGAGTDVTCTLDGEGRVQCVGSIGGSPLQARDDDEDCNFGARCVRAPRVIEGRYTAMALSGDQYTGYTYAASYGGSSTSCLIAATGDLRCAVTTRSWVVPPDRVAVPAVAVGAGTKSVCAAFANRTVRCWGEPWDWWRPILPEEIPFDER